MPRKTSAVRREDRKLPGPGLVVAKRWPNLTMIDYPLAEHKLTYMRDRECATNRFRELTREMGALLAVKIMEKHLPMRSASVSTATVEDTEAQIMADKPVLVPLLRGGLMLAEGALSILTAAHIGHIGLTHINDPDSKEKHKAVDYLVALPEPRDRPFILMDMAVATGNMACRAIEILKEIKVKPENIVFATVLIAPEGADKLLAQHPTVKVYAFNVELGIDENNYVVPGFGDSEARLFGE